MNFDDEVLERVAKRICNSRGDLSAWNRKGCKRNHWRKLAAVEIERSRGISVADAFMGIFGFKRVGQ